MKPGESVEWNTPQGKTHGKIEQTVTRETKVGNTQLKGSEADPVYLVQSEKSGKRAGHRADALKRRS